MRPPRGLRVEEAALWAKVAATVTPLDPPQARLGEGDQPKAGGGVAEPPSSVSSPAKQQAPPATLKPPPKLSTPLHHASRGPPPQAKLREEQGGLDGHWERRIKGGGLSPDFTLDLHGVTLDGAYARLNDGLAQARLMGARVVLLIAGKPRPVEAADRGHARGAIRAKVLDWLAAGPHAGSIAAIRKAHPRHGGEGALYVVLRRGR